MPTYVSVNYTTDSFGGNPTLDQKVLIFEDREDGWRFKIATAINQIPHNGYALVAVLFSYFEMIAQYAEGKSSNGNAGTYFRKGVKFVYPKTPLTDAEIDTVYGRVRCGMYHNGYTKAGVGVTGGQAQAIAIHSGNVILDPEKLMHDLNAHFAGYIAHLKNAANVGDRTNFETIFDKGTTP